MTQDSGNKFVAVCSVLKTVGEGITTIAGLALMHVLENRYPDSDSD